MKVFVDYFIQEYSMENGEMEKFRKEIPKIKLLIKWIKKCEIAKNRQITIKNSYFTKVK